MKNRIKDLNEATRCVEGSNREDIINKLHEDGKFTARERIEILYDKASFVEIGKFIDKKCSTEGKEIEYASDGVVTGYGTIDGKLIFAYAKDATVMDGSMSESHSEKIIKIQDMARNMGAPIIGISDSLGARISDGLSALIGYGKVYQSSTLISGVIPKISIIMGPAIGGSAIEAALADFVITIEKQTVLLMNGPDVLESSGTKKIDSEAIINETGLSHIVASDEKEAIAMTKALLSYLPSNNLEIAALDESFDDINRCDKNLDKLDEIETYHIISSLADNGVFFELSNYYGKAIKTGFIRLNGNTIGVLASDRNETQIDISAINKASDFVNKCDAYNIPILWMVDYDGFVISEEEEKRGLIKSTASLIYANGNATVPIISVIVGKNYGTGALTLGGKCSGSDLTFAWPTAEISLLKSEVAAIILNSETIANSADPIESRIKVIHEYKTNEASAINAARQGFIDDIIIPSETRQRLIYGFDMLSSKRVEKPTKKHGSFFL